jgi:hypothetical protein
MYCRGSAGRACLLRSSLLGCLERLGRMPFLSRLHGQPGSCGKMLDDTAAESAVTSVYVVHGIYLPMA